MADSKLVPIVVKPGLPPVWFEVRADEPKPSGGSDFELAADQAEVASVPGSLDAALDSVQPLVAALFERLSTAVSRPREIELTIGVKLSGKVGFFVAETQGEGAIEIKLKW